MSYCAACTCTLFTITFFMPSSNVNHWMTEKTWCMKQSVQDIYNYILCSFHQAASMLYNTHQVAHRSVACIKLLVDQTGLPLRSNHQATSKHSAAFVKLVLYTLSACIKLAHYTIHSWKSIHDNLLSLILIFFANGHATNITKNCTKRKFPTTIIIYIPE